MRYKMTYPTSFKKISVWIVAVMCIFSSAHAAQLAHSFPSHFFKIAGFIDLPDPDEATKVVLYHELSCTEDDQERIADIIVTLGNYSGAAEIALLAHYPRLNSHEKALRHVHPLKFIETVMKSDELREGLTSVMNGFFTRRGFFGDENSNGLAQRLTLNAKLGKVECYREDFAKALDVNAEYIRPFFEACDWEGLITYLMENIS